MAGLGISIEKADINGLKQVAITTGKTSYLVANTNQFNVFKENGIGKYRVDSNIIEEFKKLNKVYKRIKKIDQKLNLSGSSFGAINQVVGHATYIQLGEYKIPQTHLYYSEVYETLSNLVKNIKLKKVDVVSYEVGKNGPQYTFYKNDKVVKEEPISLNFSCDKIENKRICLVKKYGHITIKE